MRGEKESLVQRCLSLYRAHKEIILYCFFGVVTTAADLGVSYLLYWFGVDVHLTDLIGWICGVLVAYLTNRTWVFESKRHGFLPIATELVGFAGGRVMTFFMQEGLVFIFYDLCNFDKYLVRLGVGVIVVVVNYFISKLLIFRKKKAGGKPDGDGENIPDESRTDNES